MQSRSAMKPDGRILQALLFASGALCLLLPVFTFTQGGKAYPFTIFTILESRPVASILFLAPALGLLLALLPFFKRENDRALILAAAHAAGIAILFITKPLIFEYGSRFAALSFGGYACLAVYALGILLNGLALFSRRTE